MFVEVGGGSVHVCFRVTVYRALGGLISTSKIVDSRVKRGKDSKKRQRLQTVSSCTIKLKANLKVTLNTMCCPL